jgi:uncharacterized membrane protein YqjE
MAHQTVRNGSADARDRSSNGVIEGVSSFGNDLATLAVLQLRLFALDLRESAKVAIPIVVGLVILGMIATAGIVVGLAGISIWLAEILQARSSVVMMVIGLASLVVAGVASAVLTRSLVSSFSSFRRSREELERNLAWIKTTLVHSGR